MGYTYIISDIHGQLDCFESILKQIDLQPDDKLYVLGDVIDRGAHGIAILKKIMEMPNAEMLLGNHEFMMLNALGAPYDGISRNTYRSFELWYRNGGGLTHFAWCRLPYSQQLEILDYLRSCPLNIDIEVNGRKHRLVHAADRKFYSSYKSEYRSEAEYCVWERNALKKMYDTDINYVFGHTGTFIWNPMSSPGIWHEKNLIGIDCGCAVKQGFQHPMIGMVKGRLGCIRLEDMKCFYSEEKRKSTKGSIVSAFAH